MVSNREPTYYRHVPGRNFRAPLFFTYILFAIYHDVRTGKHSYSFLPSLNLVVTQAYCDVSTRRDGTHNRNLSPRAMSPHREARRKKCRASVTFRIGLCFRW